MSVAGTYETITKTPMGDQKGNLVMKVDNDVITGTLTFMGSLSELEPGKANGNEFAVNCETKAMFGKMKVEMVGAVDGDSITGTAKTMMGNFPFTGKRV